MKTQLMKLFFFSGILIGLLSCGNEQAPNESEKVSSNEPADTIEKPSAEKQTLSDVVEDYLRLKDALVESNVDQAKERAVNLLKVIDATQMPRIQQNTKEIAAADNMETQRVFFDSLSVNLYEKLQETKGNQHLLYKQYCPMAFNNRGAYWLSSTEEIRNPYFGEQMMTCGKVEEEIRPVN